jgi:predicted RNase H-like HicB family nuclease
MTQVWLFQWAAVGYGETREEALAQAKEFADLDNPGVESRLEDKEEQE